MKKSELKQIIKEEVLLEYEYTSNSPVSPKEMLGMIFNDKISLSGLVGWGNFEEWYKAQKEYGDEMNWDKRQLEAAKLFFKLENTNQIYTMSIHEGVGTDWGNFPKAYSLYYYTHDDDILFLMFHNIK